MLATGDGWAKGLVAGNADAYLNDARERAHAPVRQRNKVQCFTTGKSYFEAVYKAMSDAKSSIFIAGWQVNWDVELIPGQRLIDVLHDRVQSSENFRVYVLPWLSPKVGVNTHDFDTMLAIFQLNAGRKHMQAICCPAGTQNDYTGVEGAYFAHHQKLVVVDNKVAFVGGMDLAYGRYDDEKFSLKFGTRRFNERYNPGMPTSGAGVKPEGSCLSAMDLLHCTASAGTWSSGGSTEPGAFSKVLSALTENGDRAMLQMAKAVNQLLVKAPLAQANAALWINQQRAAASKAVINATTDVAEYAANSVSETCAEFRALNVLSGAAQLKVNSEPSVSSGSIAGTIEGTVRSGWNGAIHKIEQLSKWEVFAFLSPAKRAHVDEKPTILPNAVRSVDRSARSAYNVVIDTTVYTGKMGQSAAEGARQVCLLIAPAVKGVGTRARKIADEDQRTATKLSARLNAAEEKAAAAAVNAFQGGMLAALNGLRWGYGEVIDVMASAGESLISSSLITSEHIQYVIDAAKRLLKLGYMAQLAVNWAAAARHPLLLDKAVKAAAMHGNVPSDAQVRQPWQDVHLQLGDMKDSNDEISPAVYDVAMNFIGRWNATHSSYLSDLTFADASKPVRSLAARAASGNPIERVLMQRAVEAATKDVGRKLLERMKIPAELFPKEPKETGVQPAHCAVRVLRSAAIKLQDQESEATAQIAKKNPEPHQEQCEIQVQMINLIKHASEFIYIENQFFQSGFGRPSIDVFSDDGAKKVSAPMQYLMSQHGNALTAAVSTIGNPPHAKEMPGNLIAQTLGERVEAAVRSGWPFHIYFVLPVHPEGALNDITVIAQIHWTMQSLVFADHSLVNRIRRAIAAGKICKYPYSDAAWQAAMKEAGTPSGSAQAPYQMVSEAEWGKYLTLLNLRACEVINGKVRTEQIYVHSKLLIVDDRHAIIGSANINDRSQTGKRDSEIAVMIMDDAQREKAVLRDEAVDVHKVVRQLRMDLWKKHFALSGTNGLVQPASEMAALIERPAASATIEKIQAFALTNAQRYHEAFNFVPWSDDSNPKNPIGASLWPVCTSHIDADRAAALSSQMPFHDEFWLPGGPVAKAPSGIKGHFVKLPLNWTLGENNHPTKMSVMAVSMAAPPASSSLASEGTADV